MRLEALTRREASIFACICDTVVAPAPVLPPVIETDAVAFLDRWLTRAPRVNRMALRVLLYVVEVAPHALGRRGRLRTLPESERAAFLAAIERHRSAPVRQLAKLVKGVALLAYYGDDGIMLRLGYDPESNLARGRALRLEEARP